MVKTISAFLLPEDIQARGTSWIFGAAQDEIEDPAL